MRLSPQTLARASSRRPWLTVALWVAGIVVAGALSGSLLGSATTQNVGLTNNPEAQQARDLIGERLRGPERDTEHDVEQVIVSSTRYTVDSPEFRAHVAKLADALVGVGPKTVLSVATFYTTNEASLVSRDRHTTLLPTTLNATRYRAGELAPDVLKVVKGTTTEGFTNQMFGPGALAEDFARVSEEDLKSGESIGVIAALAILVIVFGAVVAAILPLLVAIGSIVLAIGIVAVVGQLAQFSFFVTNMISMMGLAVGIDYSLFIVSRFREERRRGVPKLDAIEAAGATASRAVFFSGVTVVLALLGMILIPNTIFRSLGAGAIFVVIAAMLASMTLLPALLGLLGDRVDRLKLPLTGHRHQVGADNEGGFWDRMTRRVMAHPVLSLVLGVSVLLLAASSWLDLRTGFSGVSTIPDSFESKQAFQLLAREFTGGLSSPVEIAIDGPATSPAVTAGVARLQDLLRADKAFGASKVEVNDARNLTLVSAPLAGDPASAGAVKAIERVRDKYAPQAFPKGSGARVLVGGETAFNKDFFEITNRYMPIVFAFVLGLSFLLLTVAFRSIIVPIKAILLNLLSVGAAYGLIVLVSLKGVGASLLGFQKVEVVEAWLPLFLFSVLFGLSMDYHVFLLSRIREHYDATGDNTEAIAHGVRTTARMITGAALIMVAVFGGFAAGRFVSFQQMGFGLGVAVLIDATLVRTILVPASMKLLGDRNWYLPRWLEWLPRVTVEGPHTLPAPAPAPEPVVPAGAAQQV